MDLSMGIWDTAKMSIWSSSEPIMVEIDEFNTHILMICYKNEIWEKITTKTSIC